MSGGKFDVVVYFATTTSLPIHTHARQCRVFVYRRDPHLDSLRGGGAGGARVGLRARPLRRRSATAMVFLS